jgi:hypothetical protein
VLRFFIFSLFELPPDVSGEEGGALLDCEVVRVFYKFSRNIEHRRVFLDKDLSINNICILLLGA